MVAGFGRHVDQVFDGVASRDTRPAGQRRRPTRGRPAAAEQLRCRPDVLLVGCAKAADGEPAGLVWPSGIGKVGA